MFDGGTFSKGDFYGLFNMGNMLFMGVCFL